MESKYNLIDRFIQRLSSNRKKLLTYEYYSNRTYLDKLSVLLATINQYIGFEQLAETL